MTSAEPRVPSLVMDQPPLNSLARELAESERLREFVAAPAAARISEPLVPLFLAAVFLERGGPLVVLFPDDAEARDAAEAAGWFLGEENVGLFASRVSAGEAGSSRRLISSASGLARSRCWRPGGSSAPPR